jgi:hypothetical protein
MGAPTDDVGLLPLLLWSRGTRPIPEEDASAVTVLTGGGGCYGPPTRRRDGRGRVGGKSQARRSRGGWGMAPANDVGSGGSVVEP